MQYVLVIWDNQNQREILFSLITTDANVYLLEVTGIGWLSRFPDDIVMLDEFTPEFI